MNGLDKATNEVMDEIDSWDWRTKRREKENAIREILKRAMYDVMYGLAALNTSNASKQAGDSDGEATSFR